MKSAEQGEQKAQYFLGVLCYKGIGVTQDMEQAAHWLELSENQGNADAKRLLDEISSEISSILELEPEEIDTDDDEVGVFENTEHEAPLHSRLGIMITAGVGIVLIAASVGGGYYLLSMPKVSTTGNLHNTKLEQSVTVQADSSNNLY